MAAAGRGGLAWVSVFNIHHGTRAERPPVSARLPFSFPGLITTVSRQQVMGSRHARWRGARPPEQELRPCPSTCLRPGWRECQWPPGGAPGRTADNACGCGGSAPGSGAHGLSRATAEPAGTPAPVRLGPRPAATAAGWPGSEQGWLARPRICGGSRVPGPGPVASSPSWLRDWQPRSRPLDG